MAQNEAVFADALIISIRLAKTETRWKQRKRKSSKVVDNLFSVEHLHLVTNVTAKFVHVVEKNVAVAHVKITK